MFSLALALTIFSLFCLLFIYRQNVAFLNKFRDNYQEKETERLLLVSQINCLVEELEHSIRIEMLILKAENQFVKPVFQNSLDGIKKKSSAFYTMALPELLNVQTELLDIKTNLNKKGK